MTRASARPWLIGLGVALTALAGYVDALGFLRLGGLFASFMSGNTTQLGVGLGAARMGLAGTSALVIGCFAAGAVLGGALMAGLAPRWRAAAALWLEAGAVAAACLAAGPGDAPPAAPSVDVASALLALGMGAQNAVLAGLRGFRAGATFVTGALFSAGRKLGAALVGRGPRLGWVADGAVWLTFALGATAGALGYGELGPHAFAAPACVAGTAALAALALALRRAPIDAAHAAG